MVDGTAPRLSPFIILWRPETPGTPMLSLIYLCFVKVCLDTWSHSCTANC